MCRYCGADGNLWDGRLSIAAAEGGAKRGWGGHRSRPSCRHSWVDVSPALTAAVESTKRVANSSFRLQLSAKTTVSRFKSLLCSVSLESWNSCNGRLRQFRSFSFRENVAGSPVEIGKLAKRNRWRWIHTDVDKRLLGLSQTDRPPIHVLSPV